MTPANRISQTLENARTIICDSPNYQAVVAIPPSTGTTVPVR